MNCYYCEKEQYDVIGTKNGCTIVKCQSCGFYYMTPHPTEEQMKNVYDLYDGNERNLKNVSWKLKRFKRKLWFLVKFMKGKDFLDIGCNIGFGAEAARSYGLNATGIDVSPDAIQHAKRLFPDNNYYNMTSTGLAEQGKKFDLILCCEVIEHLTDVHGFMKSIKKLLKKDGLLYLTTPDAGHFRVPKNFLAWKEVQPPEHIGFFNKKLIKNLFDEYQLKILFFHPMFKPNLRVFARNTNQETN